MNDGWIKLHRKLLDSNMYKKLTSKQRDVLIACLLLTGYKPKKWEWQGEIFTCKPGQFITSLASIKKKCAKDTKTQNIRTALVKLEKWEFLTSESTKTGRLITVLNWDTYQQIEEGANKDINKELTKHQQRANKELTTTKKDKNIKKVKNKNKYIVGQIITHLNEKAKTNYSPKTEITIEYINARIAKGFKLADFLHVIDVKCQEWAGTEHEKFLRPETLFCKKHFESYLNQKDESKKLSWADRMEIKEREKEKNGHENI